MEVREDDLLFARAKNFGHVSTLRRDGSPHSSAVWIDEEGGRIRWNSSGSTAKIRHLKRDPRVAVSIHDQVNPYRAVTFFGRAELVTEGAEEHLDEIARKYMDVDRFPEEWKTPGDQRFIVVLRPDSVSRYGY